MKKVNGVLSDVNPDDLELLKTNPEKFWEGVTIIGLGAFRKCKELTHITIPDCITEIGIGAFEDLGELKEVIFSNSLVSIGDDAFSCCGSLESAILPNSVVKLGMSAFSYCQSLKTLEISSSLTELGEGAFYECKRLRKVVIPSSVKMLTEDAFSGCNRLKTIEMHSDIEINVDALPEQLCFEYYSPKAKKSIFSSMELDLPKDEYVKIEFLEFCPEERSEIIKQINEGVWQGAALDEAEEKGVVYDEKTQKQIDKLNSIIEQAQKMIEEIKNKNKYSND